MRNICFKSIRTGTLALALVFIFACFSPAAHAQHTEHEGWKAVSSGNRKTLEGGKYYLKDDLKGDIIVKGEVELCLNGHSITGTGTGSVITVSQGASLSLCDCRDGGCITGGNATEGGGIYLDEGAGLNFGGGCISGNQATRGGGIFAAESSRLEISGGEISGNSAKSGGGIYLRCPADISSCLITENTAEYNGAGIYAEAGAESLLSLSGVSIDDNSALGHGGGIYLNNCMARLISGSVSGNEVTDAHACGGGVYIGDYAGFTMGSEARIENNSAANSGGGICVSGGTPTSDFTMEGGSISGNSAINGGGIASTGVGCFEILGGSISDNSASGDGGGIYISFAFTRDVYKRISGCEIQGNTAVNYGGGIFLQGNSFITAELSDCCIKGNNALDGGGVYVNELENLNLSGTMQLDENSCNGRGPNLYLHSAETFGIASLLPGSTIGLSLEYTDNSTFTRDAEEVAEQLKDCFVSNINGFGVVVGGNGQLQFSLACQVEFDAKGGKLEESSRMYTNGQTLGSLPVPQKDGYTFTYWDYSGRRVSEDDPVTFDKTLTANYEFNNYSLSFQANGGSGSMADLACRYTVPFKLPACSFTNEGYVFAGWSLSPEGPVEYSDGESVCNLCCENGGSISLYAQWKTAPAQSVTLAELVKLSAGETRQLKVTPQPLDGDISELVYTSNDEDIVTIDQNGLITGVAPGSATLTVETLSGTTASCTVEVGRRAPELSDFVFTQERSFDYDGSYKTPVLISYPENMSITVSYLRKEDGSLSFETPSQPGSYSIYIDVEENDSFEAAAGLTDSSWDFSILQGSQQGLSIEGAPQSVCFGQAFTLSTSGGSGDGALLWELSSGNCAVVNSETGDVYVTGTGDFTVSVTKLGNGIFDDVSASLSFTAEKRPLYLEIQPEAVREKIYDGSDSAQLLSPGVISGFRPEDEGSVPVQATARYDDSSAGQGKTITVSYDLGDFSNYYQAPEDCIIHDCAIYPMTAAIAWDYSQPLTYNGSQQQVNAYVANALLGDSVACTGYEGGSAIDAGSYTACVTALDNPNYSLEGAEGNYLCWDIQPRTVTLTVDPLHKVYGDVDPVLSYSCSDGELPPLVGEPQRDYGEDAGVYTVRQGSLALADSPDFAASNYVLEFVEGQLTVDVAGNDIYNFSCSDTAYGSEPMPSAMAAYGSVSFSYSQDPEGWFGPWDMNNAPGTWYVKASVEPTYNYKGAEAVLPFTVLNEELQAIVEPEAVYAGTEGDVFSNIAAVLPTEVELINNRGIKSLYTAPVWWDTEYMSYDPNVRGAQAVTVTGTVSLPAEVNNNSGIPLEVSIQVYLQPGLAGAGSASGSGLNPLPSNNGGGLNPLPSGGSDPFL